MRKIYTFLQGKAFFVLLILSHPLGLMLNAACTLSGIHNASDLPIESLCPGETEIVITGTINMDADYDLSASGITQITLDGGIIQWASNQNTTLTLPGTAVLLIINGGGLDVRSGCNSNKLLNFGSITIGECNDGQPGSPFSFAEINGAGGVSIFGLLPVELIRFEGKQKNESVHLSWRTASEVGNDYFLVEHSVDGRRFEALSKIAGAGNSEVVLDYDFVHKTPRPGVNYYRLRQVDYDGHSTVSAAIAVRFRAGDERITLFPNPAVDRFTIVLENETETPVFRLLNALGQEVELRVENNNPAFEIRLPAQLPGGFYFLCIERSGGERRFTELMLK